WLDDRARAVQGRFALERPESPAYRFVPIPVVIKRVRWVLPRIRKGATVGYMLCICIQWKKRFRGTELRAYFPRSPKSRGFDVRLRRGGRRAGHDTCNKRCSPSPAWRRKRTTRK